MNSAESKAAKCEPPQKDKTPSHHTQNQLHTQLGNFKGQEPPTQSETAIREVNEFKMVTCSAYCHAIDPYRAFFSLVFLGISRQYRPRKWTHLGLIVSAIWTSTLYSKNLSNTLCRSTNGLNAFEIGWDNPWRFYATDDLIFIWKNMI